MKENALIKALKSFGKTLASLFTFGPKKEPVFNLAEEAVMSPTKVVIRNFKRNKLAMFGMVWFVALLILVFGGSSVKPIDLFDTEPVLRNTQPGIGYLNMPNKLKQVGVQQNSVGAAFSVALGKDGDVYVWGNNIFNIFNVPKEVNASQIVKVAAGDRHALALTSTGSIIGWGNDEFNQNAVPFEIAGVLQLEKAVDIFAGDLYSGIITNKGKVYIWGATLANRLDIVPSALQGNIAKAYASSYNVMVLTKDGRVGILGQSGTALQTSMPEDIANGTIKLVDVAVTLRTAIGLDANGKLYAWGDSDDNMMNLPEGVLDAKIVSIDSGRSHFVALDENGKLYAWGSNKYGQSTLSGNLSTGKFTEVFSNYFQTYAIDANGKITAWGLDGFLLGTDDFGRDLAIRLLHGGRVSMTVGAVAVLISTFIGLLIGMIAGFYGGWIDNILMRFAEVISSFPFLPLAITLSSFLQGMLTQSQKLLLIMMILGVISWPGLARLIRGQILAEREKDFVLAARALGIRSAKIITRHILPNIINVVIVSMTLSYAGSLLTEAGLSFLGFGVVPPSPSWGNMLTGSQDSSVISLYWWRWILPALAVLMAALSVNIVGDGLRDAMDPKANEK
jgi:peptide/nickel transport system permease protein